MAACRCLGCGMVFDSSIPSTGKVSGNRRKYCTADCRPRYCKRKPYVTTCVECGKQWKQWLRTPSEARKTCSDECLLRGIASRSTKPLPQMTCERCGMQFRKRSKTRDSNRFCSRMCGGTLKTPEMKQADAAAKAMRKMIRQEMRRVMREERLRAIEQERNRPKLRSWICSGCGKKTETYGRLLRTCGECKAMKLKTANKIAKHRRRAAKKNADFVPVHPDVIFERDRWKCCHCGCKVSKKHDPNHDRYPNLDHVIPIAKGGSHRPENLQCLCRACNLEKSDSRVNLF
jgi:hypothetical protein